MNDKPDRMPNVPPFVKFVASAVPMVFDNSLSYYEALCALWKYVQGMTDVINNNATLEEEYIEKFNELKTFVDNYFDNLDVQEEINNKLDEMAEDGSLQELINNVLQPNVQWTFDTVADMQASENLVDGGYAKTLGYAAIGDGGGAIYKISDTGTADDIFVFECGDLYATAVNGGVQHISLAQLQLVSKGVYTLGEVDVTSSIQLANQTSRDITIVGTKFNIKTSVMITPSNNAYWSLPSFIGCVFENKTSDNSRVLITSGSNDTIGTAFTSCKFINVDFITNCNYVQDMNFTDCYIQSHTCFIDVHDKTVQCRFTRCNTESECNKLILAKDGILYFSGTYEGNINKNFYLVDIESNVTITLENCWLESVKFLNLVGSTITSGSYDSNITIIGSMIGGYTDNTPSFYVTNGGQVNINIVGSRFAAYDDNSRFTNLPYTSFRKVIGEFSTAYTYGKPFGAVTGEYNIATTKDINNLLNDRVPISKIHDFNNASSVDLVLPVGNYYMIMGEVSYKNFNTMERSYFAIVGGTPETTSTHTSIMDIAKGSTISSNYTFTATKATNNATTFTLNVSSTNNKQCYFTLFKI